MRTIILPTGPPGAGKSTLTNGLQQFMTAIARPCSVANLDPANDNVPYNPIFDVRDLVSVEEVMEREELGPNGGVLWAMEEVEANFEWLEEKMADCEETIVLDPPGQPELMQHHTALPRILHRLEKLGYRMDNLATLGGADLPFNLDFYTEVQDLEQLLPALALEQNSTGANTEASQRWERLNSALIELVTDFGLVGFETLAVEDKQSMASLLQAIDRASGYVFLGARATDESGKTVEDEASVWAQAMSENWGGKMDVRDVQERWIDRKDEFDEVERKQWAEEAKLAGALPEQSAANVVRKHAEERGAKLVEDEDELMAEQRRWQEEKAKEKHDDGGGVTRVVRKA
ncbi:hypothetical protein LTR56_007064 [Elasticomyces elasticus]|nr:hypothetical protein LTR56_007064 [Elasticomyces elasticus]KAK3664066.1 hypothetical protein LTR22_005030 [Elasticomyces elasticus]KAK4927635.1 hypothetical protein LTR49_005504 [Elasticomyces elasticus]KAK5767007.1 hypothetical protein LTS12_002772 [Elasticomyces elasticus]